MSGFAENVYVEAAQGVCQCFAALVEFCKVFFRHRFTRLQVRNGREYVTLGFCRFFCFCRCRFCCSFFGRSCLFLSCGSRSRFLGGSTCARQNIPLRFQTFKFFAGQAKVFGLFNFLRGLLNSRNRGGSTCGLLCRHCFGSGRLCRGCGCRSRLRTGGYRSCSSRSGRFSTGGSRSCTGHGRSCGLCYSGICGFCCGSKSGRTCSRRSFLSRCKRYFGGDRCVLLRQACIAVFQVDKDIFEIKVAVCLGNTANLTAFGGFGKNRFYCRIAIKSGIGSRCGLYFCHRSSCGNRRRIYTGSRFFLHSGHSFGYHIGHKEGILLGGVKAGHGHRSHFVLCALFAGGVYYADCTQRSFCCKIGRIFHSDGLKGSCTTNFFVHFCANRSILSTLLRVRGSAFAVCAAVVANAIPQMLGCHAQKVEQRCR